MGSLNEGRLREIGWLKPGEKVISITDGSADYQMGGEVYWWTESTAVDTGAGTQERKYVFKCPHDTYGDTITAWVIKRSAASKTLREAGFPVQNAMPYDKGTLIGDYVEGETLFDAGKRLSKEEHAGYMAKAERMLAEMRAKLGIELADKSEGQYIVTPKGELYLIDLDFSQDSEWKGPAFPPADAIEYMKSFLK
jgi:hypothetical protein